MDSMTKKRTGALALVLLLVGISDQGFSQTTPKEKKALSTSNRPHVYPPAQSGPVGEQGTGTRKKQVGAYREPAVLNLNDELEAISELNARKEQWVSTESSNDFVKKDAAELKKKEFFFNKFLVVDNQVLLFGDGMTGLLQCKNRGGSSLVLTEGRQINTKAFVARPSDRSLSIPDDTLCANAMTVFRSDPKGQARLIVAETLADRVTRFDIR